LNRWTAVMYSTSTFTSTSTSTSIYCPENPLCSRLYFRGYRSRCEGLAGRCARLSRLFWCTCLFNNTHWPLTCMS
jgi:hypothetical protein